MARRTSLTSSLFLTDLPLLWMSTAFLSLIQLPITSVAFMSWFKKISHISPTHCKSLKERNKPHDSLLLSASTQEQWQLTYTAWYNSRVAVATLYHMFFIQNIWWNPEEVDYHFKDNESFLELKKGFQAISLFKVIFNLLGFYFLLSGVFVLGVHCHWGVRPLMLGRNKAPKMARKQSSASEKTWQFSELAVLICLLSL